jgi:predicted MFS family arabinose efflux permease
MMVWGIFPILLFQKNFSLEQIGIITATYPAVWGLGQLVTGKMADYFCKKDMLFTGMLLQGLALLIMPWAETMTHYMIVSVVLGWGTAMVYPTFLATVAENTNPIDRPKSLGIFRLWRDLGYAIGAILTGIIADALGINASIISIGFLTVLSSFIINYRMKCRNDDSKKLWSFLSIAFSMISTKSVLILGRITWVSGSPKRILNSNSFGSLLTIINPANKIPKNSAFLF